MPHPIIDFDDGLPPDIQRKIRRTAVCRRYLSERARVGLLAAEILGQGGALTDPALAAELAGLGKLERRLRRRMEKIMVRG